VAEAKRGIRKIGPTHFEVTEHSRALLRDPEIGLLRSLRLVRDVDGGASGVIVFGVAPSGVPLALGIENGDTLESIAGKDMDSTDAVPAALRALADSDAKTATVRVKRRGQTIDLTYALVPR
jgi:S1-C subfamily serine protease